MLLAIVKGGLNTGISYSAVTNIITVTGYTAGTPCTFLDIYNADVAGSWGVVSRQCTNMFCFSAQLFIGDGSTATYFADSHTMVSWGDIWTAHFQSAVRARTNSHTTLTSCLISALQSASGYAVNFGGNILTSEYAPDFNLYYCSVSMATTNRPLYGYCITGKLEHCVFSNFLISDTLNTDIKDVTIRNTDASNYNGLINPVGGTLDDIKIYDCPMVLYIPAGAPSTTWKNLTAKNTTTYDIRSYNNSSDHYFINTVFDSTNWRLDFGGYTGKIYRQYEFDLKAIDKDNSPINAATVKIWDKDSNLIVDTTTNASGVIATQTITRGYYNQANGNTLQEASPHLIKIEKAGYTTYEADFTLGVKTDWLIALQAAGGGLMRNPPMTGGMV